MMPNNTSIPSSTDSTHTAERISQKISRAEFLKQFFLLSGAALTACTPLRIALQAYPGRYAANPGLREKMLQAFVTTVIPGLAPDAAHSTRMLTDEFYPFHSYANFFVADLAQRSARLFRQERFDQLAIAQRTGVIQDGLQADATTARLYQAAIYMTQLSCYASIYDDQAGCTLIDFHGANPGFPAAEVCYANHTIPLAHEATNDGNPS